MKVIFGLLFYLPSCLCICIDRRNALCLGATIFASPHAALAGDETSLMSGREGIVNTDAALSKSVRGAVIRGAQVADRLDEKWERFSDSLRDRKACDPRTGRRMYDNGFRSDGSRLGNPILGALCESQPVKPLQASIATFITQSAEETSKEIIGKIDEQEMQQTRRLVGPAFSPSSNINSADESKRAREALNFDVYVQFRTYSEISTAKKDISRRFERSWGKRLLAELGQREEDGAFGDRNDFKSPFPIARPDPDDISYEYSRLLDALGRLCVAFTNLERNGFIGKWEISIPEDDDGAVVTIAIDDDATIGAQVLLREQNQSRFSNFFAGSVVQALVRAALEDIVQLQTFRMDAFFLDPSTTQQSIYNPTQLLLSISSLSK